MILGIDASRANHDQKTGVEWYAYHLIQELKKIIQPTVSVILYTDEPLKGELSDLPSNWTQKILGWPPRRLWTQIRLSTEMVLNPPDILFIPAHVAPLIHPKKTVMMLHDVAALKYPKSYNWFERWYSIWSARFAVKHLWRVLAPSDFTKKELVKFGSKNKIHVVRHGYKKNNTDFRPILNRYRQILHTYEIKEPYLMTIGRMEAKKNTRRIIEAFEIVRSKQPMQLVLVGKSGYDYAKVREIIENSPFRADIRELGWLPQEAVQTLLAHATVFVFPSLYEGFGLPVLEAFAAGAPVIASRGSALEEVGGDAALYVDPENVSEIALALEQVLSNEQLRTTLVHAGRERLEHFSWDKCARETLDVLNRDK